MLAVVICLVIPVWSTPLVSAEDNSAGAAKFDHSDKYEATSAGQKKAENLPFASKAHTIRNLSMAMEVQHLDKCVVFQLYCVCLPRASSPQARALAHLSFNIHTTPFLPQEIKCAMPFV